jgi:hypothetical protein
MRFAWRMGDGLGNIIGDRWHLRLVSFWRWLLRVGFFLWILAALPWVRLKMRWGRKSATARLQDRIDELWRTAPFEALQLLRSVSDDLESRNLENEKGPKRRARIEPFGDFSWADAAQLRVHLYECQDALAQYEAALATCKGFPESAGTILMPVHCLVAMKRQSDAVALLEQKLPMDNWRGDLRARLAFLTGHAGSGVN